MSTAVGLQLINAFRELVTKKNISQEVASEILSEAIIKAFLKEDPDCRVDVTINLEKGIFKIQRLKKVVSDDQVDYDEINEIPVSDRQVLDQKLQIGDDFREDISIDSVDRNKVTYVAQLFTHRLTELTNKTIIEEWMPKVGSTIIAEVEKIDEQRKFVIVNLEKTSGYVDKKNQIPNEKLIPGRHYKFVVEKVKEQSKDWMILLSRASPELVLHELTLEIPEIAENKIKVEKIVRLAGFRTKIAISCDVAGIDPIGACLGYKGSRIKQVSSQINGEKIDVILWDPDPIKFVINAVDPAHVVGIEIVSDGTKKTMTVVVEDEKDLSIIVGKSGKNVKLLTQLVDWGIDVISKKQADEQKIKYVDYSNYSPRHSNVSHKHPNNSSPSFAFANNQSKISSVDQANLQSYTTIIRNDDDIEVDVAKSDKKESMLKEETSNIVDDLAAIGSENETIISEESEKNNGENSDDLASSKKTDKKTSKKIKKFTTSRSKIDLSDLTVDFILDSEEKEKS